MQRLKSTSKSLQDPSIDLFTAVELYQSLFDYISMTRNNDFDSLEEKAKSLLINHAYTISRKRTCEDASISMPARNKLGVNSFVPIMNSIIAEIEKRTKSYLMVKDILGFLTNFKSFSSTNLRQKCIEFVELYPNDLEMEFIDEFLQFSFLFKSFEVSNIKYIDG